MALARPVWTPSKTQVINIRSQRTGLATRLGVVGAKIDDYVEILSTLMTIVTSTTVRTGASIGTVIRRNVCHSVAPSTYVLRAPRGPGGQARRHHHHSEAGPIHR